MTVLLARSYLAVRDNLETIALVIGSLVIAAVVAWALVVTAEEQARWEAWCGEQGGRVIKDTDTSTGVGYSYGDGSAGSGGVVVTTTTNTDYYCINATGGIVDIR